MITFVLSPSARKCAGAVTCRVATVRGGENESRLAHSVVEKSVLNVLSYTI